MGGGPRDPMGGPGMGSPRPMADGPRPRRRWGWGSWGWPAGRWGWGGGSPTGCGATGCLVPSLIALGVGALVLAGMGGRVGLMM